ncbi:MAG: response regulator [Planctomycetota bacterium]|jgi:two-component system chemotaxis response regulator CheY
MTDTERVKVLTVDDSRVTLKILRKLLAETEFEVVGEARQGEEALSLFRDLNPDLVILDIVMPDMDGVKILEGIRGLDPGAKVVMVSSLGTKEKVMECLEKGAKNFLMKPYEKEDLLKVLRKVVEEAKA